MKEYLDAIMKESDTLVMRIADLRARLATLTESLDPNSDDLEPYLQANLMTMQINALESYSSTLSDIEHLAH